MMDDSRWRAGYARLGRLGLHFELQAPFSQLAEAARLARDYPDTTIVLNHAGLPTAGGAREWRSAMAGLAACSNVAVKISGMGAPVREFVLGVLELFGIDRTMFASNYPVDSLRASFATIYAGFEEITRGLREAERRALFHDNALRIYRMR